MLMLTFIEEQSFIYRKKKYNFSFSVFPSGKLTDINVSIQSFSYYSSYISRCIDAISTRITSVLFENNMFTSQLEQLPRDRYQPWCSF